VGDHDPNQGTPHISQFDHNRPHPDIFDGLISFISRVSSAFSNTSGTSTGTDAALYKGFSADELNAVRAMLASYPDQSKAELIDLTPDRIHFPAFRQAVKETVSAQGLVQLLRQYDNGTIEPDD
jgi:hypothetical protein